jgi:DNA ligase-1
MGYTRGEGKRTAFGVGQMLLGVRRGEEFVTVTKLGTGTTEAELTDLHKKLNVLASKDQPKEYADVAKNYTPDVWVTPSIVLEIAGDDLTISPTHGAGYAVRFPRLVRIRTDKSASQVTSVKELEEMYRNQSSMNTGK